MSRKLNTHIVYIQYYRPNPLRFIMQSSWSTRPTEWRTECLCDDNLHLACVFSSCSLLGRKGQTDNIPAVNAQNMQVSASNMNSTSVFASPNQQFWTIKTDITLYCLSWWWMNEKVYIIYLKWFGVVISFVYPFLFLPSFCAAMLPVINTWRSDCIR